LCASTIGGMVGEQFTPSSYRSLQITGSGEIANRLGISGKRGPHNWLESLIPGIWSHRIGSLTLFMTPEMARYLQEFGFNSKQAVYDWIWKRVLCAWNNSRKAAFTSCTRRPPEN